MNRMLRVLILAVPAALLVTPVTSWAVFDAFLKLDGIEGESLDAKHKGEIEVLSYHWGETQGTPGSAARVNMDALAVTKFLDKSSPKLARACALGRVIPTATLVLVHATRTGAQPFMTYQLTNALVTSVQAGGSAQGESGVPIEEIALSFSKICWIYTVIDLDGKAGGEVSGCYDLAGSPRNP